MHRRMLAGLVAASALALTLTACSAPATENSSDPMDSPLNKYMASAWGGDLSEEEQQKRAEEQQAKTEEFVAACMKDEGFEYIPQPQTGMSFGSSDDYKPEDREWVSQYGYGMINSPGMNEPIDPDAEQWVDVNADYVASLSEAEQMAFYEALSGPQPTEEELSDPDFSWEYNWETAGCYGFAQHELEGDKGEDPYSAAQHKPLMDAMSTLYEDMMTSSDFTELDGAWSDCMADAGYPGFTTQGDAQTSISDDLNEYWESQGDNYLESDAVRGELGGKEIAVALADLGCREKTDYRAKQTAVSFALEEQFIQDHKAELDAFLADAEQFYGTGG